MLPMDRKAIDLITERFLRVKWFELALFAMSVLVVLVAYFFYMAGHAQGWIDGADHVLETLGR